MIIRIHPNIIWTKRWGWKGPHVAHIFLAEVHQPCSFPGAWSQPAVSHASPRAPADLLGFRSKVRKWAGLVVYSPLLGFRVGVKPMRPQSLAQDLRNLHRPWEPNSSTLQAQGCSTVSTDPRIQGAWGAKMQVGIIDCHHVSFNSV